jgi:hypothetical protein
VRGSELDWITVRPVKLVDRPARHRYRVARDGSRLALAYSTISRADVAEFLVAQLVDDAHVRAAPVIGD